jgi:hypothetical protein
MDNIEEFWRPIKGYEGIYRVSNLGRIKSLSRLVQCKNGYRKTKEKILKPHINKSGYCSLDLGKKNKHLLHRIVANAFIPNPDNKPCVNHLNGIKSDNKFDNLEWCTYSENEKHSYLVLGKKSNLSKNRQTRKGSKSNFSKFTDLEIEEIKNLILENTKPSKIIIKYNISKSYISRLKNNKRRI